MALEIELTDPGNKRANAVPPPPPGFQLVPQPPAGFVLEGQGVPLEQSMDKRRGAPAQVRRDVGGAPIDDRLPTIRRYFPDAQPFGDDNFVFTDPATGRPTLYNPPGMDAGDVASVVPEIAEFGGGVIGGAAVAPAAIAAAPATAGASLLTIPMAYGLGAAAGREVENIGANLLGQRQDTRGIAERGVDVGLTTSINAAGGRIGELIGQGFKAVTGPVANFARNRLMGGGQQALNDFANVPVTPSAGAVTGNRAVQFTEQALSSTPGGGSVIQGQQARQIAEITSAADDVARRFGGGRVRTVQEAGEVISEGARAAGDRFAQRREALDDLVEQAVGGNTLVPVANVQRYVAGLRQQLGSASESLRPALQDAIQEGERVLADAAQNLRNVNLPGGGGQIPFSTLRRIRTRIGQDLDSPDVTGYRPSSAQSLAGLYGALRADVQAAAESAGPAARHALDRHDRYVRLNRRDGGNLELLEKIRNQGTDAQAFNFAMQGAKDSGQRLMQLRRNLRPDEWDAVAGTVLGRLGRSKGQITDLAEDAGEFSAATFMTNLKNLSPEARRALFSGTRYASLTDDLNNVIRVVARLEQAGRRMNFSNTAPVLLQGLGLYEAGQAVVEGDVAKPAGIAVGTILAPRVAAKLITNPRFVRWLATSVPQQARPNGLSASLGRLVGIAKAEPEIREEIHQYLAAMRGEGAPASNEATEATAGTQ